MPHDPSNCQCCRWLAEREGYQWAEGGYWKLTDLDSMRTITSFCTSLDAVAGLWAEIIEATDNPEWWALERIEEGWGFYKLRCLGSEHVFMHELTTLEYLAPPDMPGQPIIDAAMRVLGDKESDGEG